VLEEKNPKSQVLWFTPVILALRSLRQEDSEFEASRGYAAKSCLNKPKKQNKNKQNPHRTISHICFVFVVLETEHSMS
jgi:hypothetical protein